MNFDTPQNTHSRAQIFSKALQINERIRGSFCSYLSNSDCWKKMLACLHVFSAYNTVFHVNLAELFIQIIKSFIPRINFNNKKNLPYESDLHFRKFSITKSGLLQFRVISSRSPTKRDV